jgi:hypothetical protein
MHILSSHPLIIRDGEKEKDVCAMCNVQWRFYDSFVLQQEV